MASIAIYGGSFNPVHFGHTGLAEWVLRHTPIDEVWMLVSPNNPLKDSSILADEKERLANLKRVLHELGDSGLSEIGKAVFRMDDGKYKAITASDFEFGLPRPTYTAHTLRQLTEHYPEHRFTLLIGEDNYRLFDRWREWEYIMEHFPIIVYPRRSSNSLDISGLETNNSVRTPHSQISFLTGAPYFDVSSTEIRENTYRRQNLQ